MERMHGMVFYKVCNTLVINIVSSGLSVWGHTSAYLQDDKYLPGMFTEMCAAKSLQSCPTLCDPIDVSPRGSPVPGIHQARTLEWAAVTFSNAGKWKVKSLSCVRLLATPWTAAHQAPSSMGFSRQEYWSGLPLPSPTLKIERIKIHFFIF